MRRESHLYLGLKSYTYLGLGILVIFGAKRQDYFKQKNLLAVQVAY